MSWNREKQNQENRPRIADHLKLVSGGERESLLVALIEIDIGLRLSAGERVQAGDYRCLGADAVSVALKHLDEPGLSLEQGSTNTTAFDTISALNDESDDCSFEVASQSPSALDPATSPDVRAHGYIGRYKLLQEIGIGGMGSVWMAEQKEPVVRRVALKVIRADIDSTSAVARFEAERQAIAMMDHQNIAKILDAGTTESGNPYFVMELVNGVPLNQYCDRKKLSVRQRLELMIPVCRAVQHAHQKGIIHRDLKHSNVLVTEYDGNPVPKVIDFGLAKALGHQQTLTDKTMFTEVGKVVGTLQYMSPEQAETGNMDVDTRTDIYSLGVMIYKLLTGVTPLDNGAIVEVSLLHALQIIREKDPSRPSVRVDEQQESIDELCSLRQVQPERLKQMLSGDLDWIVMKSLEKDRRDRYETANGLAMELERYLADEPVLARPRSAIYSIKKFVKRNRGLVASLAGFAALLLAGIVATSLATRWALQERDRANNKSVMATAEKENAQRAESDALQSERRRRTQQELREIELYSMRLRSAWSDWQLGNAEPAWLTLNMLADRAGGWEREYVRSEFVSSEVVMYGHARSVASLDVSPDGRLIATASDDNTIRIWDSKTKSLISKKILDHEPTCVRFSPDSQRIATSGRSNHVKIWSVESAEPLTVFGPYPKDILSVAFSPDGNQLAASIAAANSYLVDNDREFDDPSPPSIAIISMDDGRLLQEFAGHTDDITAVAYSPDGQRLVSGSLDKTVCVWSRDNGQFELQQTFSKHFRGVTDVTFSPSGTRVASSSQDETARIWEVETGELILTVAGHNGFVNSVDFDREGERIVTSSSDRTARIWNLDGEELLVCQGHFDVVRDAKFSQSGDEILTASGDFTVRSWSAQNKPGTVVARAHEDTAWAADLSADGTVVASVSEDGSLVFIDALTGNLIGDGIQHDDAILAVAYSPDSKLIAYGGADCKLRILDTQSKTIVQTIDAHDDFIWSVAFSPDGSQLATASADHSTRIWQTDDWSIIEQLGGHTGEVASVRYSADGLRLVTASDDHTVNLWDAATFELLHCFKGHNREVWRAAFSPDDKLIASSAYDGGIILWDAISFKRIRQFVGHTNQVAGLTFSNDGRRIVSASDDRTIRIWDVASGIELFVLRDKEDSQIVHVSFSDDGRKLISGNAGGWITIRAVQDVGAHSRPVLPQNVQQAVIRDLSVIREREASPESLQKALASGLVGCRHYPTFKTFRNVGIAQYRLGQYDECVESLTEALRLEPIQYGEPDLRPEIEGFLAMACLKTDRRAKAAEMREAFKTKQVLPAWTKDQVMFDLAKEVEQAFSASQ